MSSQAIGDSDSTIHLAKIGKLNLLRMIFGRILIPEEVYREAVVLGIEKGYPEAYVVVEAYFYLT